MIMTEFMARFGIYLLWDCDWLVYRECAVHFPHFQLHWLANCKSNVYEMRNRFSDFIFYVECYKRLLLCSISFQLIRIMDSVQNERLFLKFFFCNSNLEKYHQICSCSTKLWIREDTFLISVRIIKIKHAPHLNEDDQINEIEWIGLCRVLNMPACSIIFKWSYTKILPTAFW